MQKEDRGTTIHIALAILSSDGEFAGDGPYNRKITTFLNTLNANQRSATSNRFAFLKHYSWNAELVYLFDSKWTNRERVSISTLKDVTIFSTRAKKMLPVMSAFKKNATTQRVDADLLEIATGICNAERIERVTLSRT